MIIKVVDYHKFRILLTPQSIISHASVQVSLQKRKGTLFLYKGKYFAPQKQNYHKIVFGFFYLLNFSFFRLFSESVWSVREVVCSLIDFFLSPKRKKNQDKSLSNPAPARVFCSRARKKTRFAEPRFTLGSASFAANLQTGFSLRPATKSRAVGICSKASWAARKFYRSFFDFRQSFRDFMIEYQIFMIYYF